MSGLVGWLQGWWTGAPSDENMVARPRLRSRERAVQRIAREVCSESPPPERVILWARDEYQNRMDDAEFEREFNTHMDALHRYSERTGALSALKRLHRNMDNMRKHNENPRNLGDLWKYQDSDFVNLVADEIGRVKQELEVLRGGSVVQGPGGIVKGRRRDSAADDAAGGQDGAGTGHVRATG